MKPSARIQASIDVLEKTSSSRIPMDSTIGDYMRGRRYIGSKDRAAVVERVYALVRGYARLLWHIEHNGATDTPRNFMIAHLALVEKVDEKRLKDLFDGSKFSPEELTPDEIALFLKLQGQELDHPDMPIAARVECPPQYEQKLREYFGGDFEKEMAAMLPTAILDIRVNLFICPRDKARESLAKDGVDTTETPYSPWGLRVKGKVFLSKTKAFAKGWIDIQDEGSQLIAHMCGAKPGQQVLDYCAGGGGKTLALASAMMRKGRIVAMDTEERRLEKGRERFRRAQVSDIIEIRPLSDERHRKWLRRQKETFDVVLADVPCTGTGTWRRNPDMRWKDYGPGLEELLKTQNEILEKVAPCVKPGGRLVYATCSLLPDENENQIDAFLARHPEFKVQPPENEKLGSPYMRLTPYRHQTDGFFAAILIKQPA